MLASLFLLLSMAVRLIRHTALMTSKTVMGVLGEGNGAITLQTANGRITASSF